MTKVLTYVEIDIPRCILTYGISPCTAELGVTGDIKCFNSKVSCQDTANIDLQDQTLRFAIDTNYLPKDIPCIPSIESVSLSPAMISLGENLGERAQLTVTFNDHRDSDTGPGGDKYVTERPYDPFKQGTYWGKFRARHPYLRGQSIRLIRGELGQSLAEMETRHYVIESFDGPTPDGKYSLIAKDVLKLADGDRAQAPAISNGFLSAALTNVATSFTISPSGVGNAEYPASGHVAIGGKEIVSFTRSGDSFTIVRAQLGTEAQEHNTEDRVQLVKRYQADDPADIISDLLQTYAGIPASYIPLADWQLETSTYVDRVYTGTIAEPTAVKDLISELCQQSAIALWWSDTEQIIRLQVLRAVSTEAARYTEANTERGSLDIREQPDKRLSQIWTYFGKINPLEKHDDPDNYRSVAATVELEAEADYGTPVIKKIYSRWIAAFGRAVALKVNALWLSRYRDPPRRFTFDVLRSEEAAPQLGGGYRVEAWPIQDVTGATTNAPIQITRLNPKPERFSIEAEEMLFTAQEVDERRVITIDTNARNLNLRSIHDTLYAPPVGGSPGEEVLCIISDGVVVGSNSINSYAFQVGSWPAGVEITIVVNGVIVGRGGNAGNGATAIDQTGGPGQNGGPSFRTTVPILLDVTNGWIGGGGGGGGGGAYGVGGGALGARGHGGGGGAGDPVGAAGGGLGGKVGNPGLLHRGGNGGNEGSGTPPQGGNLGQNGEPGDNNPPGTGGDGGGGGGPGGSGGNGGKIGTIGQGINSGGTAGIAINGNSLITVTGGNSNIYGPRIN